MPRRKKISQKEVSDGLRRLAFGKITDAISLLFEDDESVAERLGELDLINVSEIKRAKGGAMEIKFFDRLKAIDKLSELAQKEKSKEPTSFYDALFKGAEATKGKYSEEYDE